MSNKVKVSFKYLYTNPVKRSVEFKQLIKDLIQTRATFLQNWLETDHVYDPTNDFKVSKLTLDKDGKPTFVELTEMENRIYE